MKGWEVAFLSMGMAPVTVEAEHFNVLSLPLLIVSPTWQGSKERS